MRTNRLLSLISGALLAVTAHAQAPQGFSYQAVARDAFGNAMAGQSIGVQFVLHQGSALGPVVYAETHSATTNSNGLFALTVGGGSTGTGTFSSIDWSSGPYFMEVGMDVSNSGSYTPIGTQQLMSVPYALYAGKSNVPDGTEVGQILHWDGDEWVAEPGLYVQGKRFGIGGETSPESPLGIKGEPGQDDRMISFASNDDSQKWNINLNPTGGDVAGFSIDDLSSGTGSSRLFIAPVTGNVGIGTTEPEAAFSIKTRSYLKSKFSSGSIPVQEDFGFGSDSTGFGIVQGLPGSMTSRLFIRSSTGNVGLGTENPLEKLSIHTNDPNGRVGLSTTIGSGAAAAGWVLAHRADVGPIRSGAFTISETLGSDLLDRITIMPGGKVGINEKTPDTFLHVSRPDFNPDTGTSLDAGSGIATFGDVIDSMLNLQDDGLQARAPAPPGSPYPFAASDLNLQPMGGDLRIHEATHVLQKSGVITNDAWLGLGTLTPVERIDIDGAIKIGNSENANDGTIRWTGTDFEGRKGGQWNSLTTHTNTDGFWQSGSPGEIHFSPPAQANVGIGTGAPQEKLHVSGAHDGGSVSIMVENLESSSDGGWLMSVVDDNAVAERMKTFAVHEKTGTELAERITVLSGGNVGINEGLPDTKLHVSRSLADPGELISLQPGSGVIMVGTLSDNIAMDHQGIQARHLFGGATSTVGVLHAQRLGGDVLFHGDPSVPDDRKVVITDAGRIGVGKTPMERLDVNGAITLGTSNSETPEEGTIRWNGSDFQGMTGNGWTSITFPMIKINTHTLAFNPPDPRLGIGTDAPATTLHVSRPSTDPEAPISLQEGSGMVMVGPLSDNIVMDHQGIQARHLLGGATSMSGSGLHLQRLGGDVLFHGDASTEAEKVVVRSDGKVGIGVLLPAEKLHLNGAVVVGNTDNAAPQNGTIRYSTGRGDLEGFVANAWTSLSSKWEKVDNSTDPVSSKITYNPANAMVGIGVGQPSAALHVRGRETCDDGNAAMLVENPATTTSTDASATRIGLDVNCTGLWSSNDAAKNIGLLVNASGAGNANANLAAVLNGNVVVGDIAAQSIGADGTNVLAIQNGTVPAASSGAPVGGIQIYSDDIPGTGSAFHVMNGDGTVIKLHREASLTVADPSAVGPVYDPITAALIENMRTRINELESRLQTMGLLH